MKTTKIAVFGATGKVGNHFVEQALEAGYTLRVLVRNESRFNHADHDNVEVVVGDATRFEDVERTISDAQVVVSCLGNPKRALIMEKAYDNIMTAAAGQAQPPRCIMISSIGLGGSSWLIKLMLTLIAGKAAVDDGEKADKQVREDREVSFVLVRPYALTNSAGLGRYKIIRGKDGTFARPISRRDVALFMLRCVEDKGWDNRAVMLGGKRRQEKTG